MAGRNVATVSLAGERLDVVVREIRAVVDRRGLQLDREPHARPEPELVAVHAQAEPGPPARLEHRPRLVGVERALLAEHVDPARVRPARVEHLAAHQVDVLVRAVLVLRRQGVRAEEGHVVGELGGHDAGAALGLGLEPVAGLDLDVRDPGLHGLPAAGARERLSSSSPAPRVASVVTLDPGRRVRPARHAGGELVGAVAGEHEVGVAVNEPRNHAAAGRVDALVARRPARSMAETCSPSMTSAASRTIP